MIANHRYLHGSIFSFCIHAAIFLYIYGTFNSDTSQTLLISKPLQIELKFDLSTQNTKKPISSNIKVQLAAPNQTSQDLVYSKTTERVEVFSTDFMFESNISTLLSEESEIEMSKEQQEILKYAQKIIFTIENAWMKPKNIPEGLVANLRLKIRSSGRIIRVDLIKSSGNIRFDNSALQAVRRVETFNFFNSIPKSLYEKEFQGISISFNPS